MTPITLTALVIALVLTVLVRVNRAPDFTIWGGVTLLAIVPVHDPHSDGWRIGVLSVTEALAGLANDGVVTIAAMFIVAAGLRETGALQLLVQNALGTPKSVASAQHRVVWPTAALSGFFNNTPLVALLLPMTDDWAKRHAISISKLLMPLSFASILGGACTLIGTSTNLIVNGWLIDEAEHPGLGMFEITPVALPIAIVGIVFVVFGSRWLLPPRKAPFEQLGDARQYVVEMVVDASSELVSKSVEEAGLRGLPGLFLIEIDRRGEVLPAVSGNIRLEANDQLIFAGVVDSVVDLQRFTGLRPATDQVFKLDEPRRNRMLVEAVVSNTCPLVGMTIREGRFRTIYNAAVIAVARNGERVKQKIGDITLRSGDTLLLEARPTFVDQQRNRRDFYLVSEAGRTANVNHARSPYALLILAAIIGTVSTGLASMLQASLVGAMIVVASGCCNASIARRSIDWEILLVIAGAIGLGKAMDASGLASLLGTQVRSLFGTDPMIMLAAIFALAMVLSALVTAKAGVVLMLPVALAAAEQLEVSFMPYVVAVMLAGSMSVATPIGYPTNLMVYGPGGYRFSDYLRLGGPLSLLIWCLAVVLIPIAWPF